MKTPAKPAGNPWQVPAPPIAPLAFKVPPPPEPKAAPVPEFEPAPEAVVLNPAIAALSAEAQALLAKVAPVDDADKEARARKLSDKYVRAFDAAGGEVVSDPKDGARFAVAVENARRAPLGLDALRSNLARTASAAGLPVTKPAADEAAFAIMARTARREPVSLRYSESPDRSRIYVDLAEPDTGAAVEIDADGSRVIDCPPVLFRRAENATGQLPRPVAGGSLAELGALLGLVGEAAILVIACLLGAILPGGPFALLALTGPQGSGKSTIARRLKSLIDPSAAPLRGVPGDEKELAVALQWDHLLVIDNASNISRELSDDLCRITGGGGFAFRQLYTDDAQRIFAGAHPLIITTIDGAALARADLADRAVVVEVPARALNVPERELDAAFAEATPRILGALYAAASGALRHLATTPLDGLPRLADFARWLIAAERSGAMPWEAGAFLAAYTRNRSEVAVTGAEGDPVGAAVLNMMRDADAAPVEATAATLLQILAPPAMTARTDFPRNPREMSNALVRVAPQLARLGIVAERKKSHGVRLWRLFRAPSPETPEATA